MADMVVSSLDAMIVGLETQIKVLREAREKIAGVPFRDGPPPLRLAPASFFPPAPTADHATDVAPSDTEPKTPRKQKPRGEMMVMEVNGVDVELREQQQAVMELLNANEFVKSELILPIYDGSAPQFWAQLRELRDRLVPAKAQITNTPGQGYALVNL